MRASVVIPTFNRLADLQRTITAIEEQENYSSSEVEIVVVDDGSTDGTREWLQFQTERPEFIVLRQANSGPAIARNRGVEAASGDIIIFLGDDTVPEAGWLQAHLEEHRLFSESNLTAVLGYTAFPPEVDSPFLRWINENGAQFGYRLIDSPKDVPFNFFYTSNISIPRDVLIQLEGFREDFPAAAWEDIEFAYRAAKIGMRLRYQPLARTIHFHRIRSRTFCRRQRTSGMSATIFAGLHPELENFLGFDRLRNHPFGNRLQRSILRLWVEAGEWVEGVVPGKVYQRYLDLCYLEGLAEVLHDR